MVIEVRYSVFVTYSGVIFHCFACDCTDLSRSSNYIAKAEVTGSRRKALNCMSKTSLEIIITTINPGSGTVLPEIYARFDFEMPCR